jgi:hypothetical protein
MVLGSLIELAVYGIGSSTAIASAARRGIVRVDTSKIRTGAIKAGVDAWLSVGESALSYMNKVVPGATAAAQQTKKKLKSKRGPGRF